MYVNEMTCGNFLSYNNDFLGPTPNSYSIEEIIFKLNFMKSENISL